MLSCLWSKSQLQQAISRLSLQFLRVRWQHSVCLPVTERKTETEKLKNQQQKHEKINLAFSSVITQHS